MQRSTHVFLACLVVSLTFLDRGYAEKKPSIATAEFLSVLAKNVATVLSPTLVGELQEGRPNRTAVNASISPPPSTTPSSTPEATSEPLRSTNLEADTVRSAQTQSEVRPGNNQGFPFNFDDNNFRYNYPGINSQGAQQRPDFSSGPFGNAAYYNSELYRAYASQGGPEVGLRPEDAALQRGQQVTGVTSVETAGNGQTGRVPETLDPSTQNLDRFRNFDRQFPFGNQFNGGPGNFANFPFQAQRQDGRFAQPLIDQYNPNANGAPANPNFLGNANFQNSVSGANFPRNSFQSFGDPFQQRQQSFRSNFFDQGQPIQRFQNAFENYPRNLQRGPNFPGDFYPGHLVPESREPSENFATPAPRIDPKKIEEVSSSELSAKSQKLEKLETGSEGNSTSREATVTENPEILSVQGRIRFGRLLLPALEDYSDLRFQPDSFRQYLFTPSDVETKNKSDVSINNKTNTNDI